MPKGRVMFFTNAIKVVGCVMMLFYAFLTPPNAPEYLTILIAYAVVGLGAAAYSPAKYGILTEPLPAQQLVAANGWIEGLTVGSIILGTLVGGALVSETISVRCSESTCRVSTPASTRRARRRSRSSCSAT